MVSPLSRPDHSNVFTLSHNTQTRSHAYKLLKPPPHLSCRVNYFGTRVINDWNNLTSDIVGNSSLNNFKSAIDNYFYDHVNVIIIFIVNFCLLHLIYVCICM